MKLAKFNFVVDRWQGNRPYPALAQHQAQPGEPEWQEFHRHWPYTVPCSLIDYCEQHEFPYELWDIDSDYPSSSYFAIGLGWFDFATDYFGLLPAKIMDAVRAKRLRILFYYHEGDSPELIEKRLTDLCLQSSLDPMSYQFVSGNTAANQYNNFAYFPDHELRYWQANKRIAALACEPRNPQRDFTVLSRSHKWWRATVIADLHRNGILSNSYWSYTTEIACDQPQDNPIGTEDLNIDYYLEKFLAQAPYRCDSGTSTDHNDHGQLHPELFTDSHLSIVLETLIDADGSSGAFLTEKTFKCLKHGHPFVVIGCQHSILQLRKLGYHTFDDVVDHSYDTIKDANQRYRAVFQEIVRLRGLGLATVTQQTLADRQYNQQLFLATKQDRLNMLHIRLTFHDKFLY